MRSLESFDVETVRRASPILDVVCELIGPPATTHGQEPKFPCPFHPDHTPSLRVNTEKQVYRCDPCDVGGDVFDFVQRVERLAFPEALAWLAKRSGPSNRNGRVAALVRTTSRPDRVHLYVEHGAPLLKVVVRGRGLTSRSPLRGRSNTVASTPDARVGRSGTNMCSSTTHLRRRVRKPPGIHSLDEYVEALPPGHHPL